MYVGEEQFAEDVAVGDVRAHSHSKSLVTVIKTGLWVAMAVLFRRVPQV